MNTDTNNDPVRETAVLDGGDLTEQEKALSALSLEDLDDDGTGTGDDAAGGAAAAAPAEGEAAAQAAAAQRSADEQAAAAAAQQQREQAEADAARQAAEAKANAEAIARAAAAEKPAPPADFDAQLAELDQQLDDGDIEEAAYAREVRKITLAQADHNTKVTLWEAEQRRLQEDAKAAQQRAENAWNLAALQWESDNAEFMADRLCAAAMQDAINRVITLNAQQGVHMAPAQVLDEAARFAFRATGYTPPAPAAPNPAADPKLQVAAAVAARKPAPAPQTLGDLPNAGAEQIRGNEAFASLDSAPIEDLEAAVQHMTGDQLEKFLRDAPGANANGRGD